MDLRRTPRGWLIRAPIPRQHFFGYLVSDEDSSRSKAGPQVSGIAYDNASFSPGLGALRGIAALGVVVFHVLLVLPVGGINAPDLEPLDPMNGPLLAQHLLLGLFNGRGLVVLFFVLSECVLAMSLHRIQDFGLRHLPGYWIRRGFRLYPLLILAATLGALLQLKIGTDYLDAASDWVNWHYNVPEDQLLGEWLKNAVGHSNSLNSPAWSIKIELIASFVFPLIYLVASSRSGVILGAILLIAAMFLAPGEPDNYLRMNVFTFCFFIGAAIPLHMQHIHRVFVRLPDNIYRLLLISVVLTFMFARRVIDPSDFDSPAVTLVESICAAVLIAVALFNPRHRFSGSPVLQWLGRVSYGVYLLHLIVLFALVHFARPLLPVGDTSEALSATALLLVATLMITLPTAWFFYRVLERPLQRLGAQSAGFIDRQLIDEGSTDRRGVSSTADPSAGA